MTLIKQSQNGIKMTGLRDGSGDAFIFPSESPLDEGPIRMASRIELAPGASIGLHLHHQDEEVYAIISGEGLYGFDGGECRAKTGDIFVTKKGSSHSLKNNGNSPLIFFAVVAQ